MNELISRQAAIDAFYIQSDDDGWWVGTAQDAETLLKGLPSAEPVKHGRWIWNKRLGEWYCSNCDRIMKPYIVEKSEGEYEMAQPFYCGWCGARIDLDEVEE